MQIGAKVTLLFHIENVAYAGLSASGKGFFLIIPIAYPKRHKEQFAAIHRDFFSLGLAIDMAPKNEYGLSARILLGPRCAVPASGQAVSEVGEARGC